MSFLSTSRALKSAALAGSVTALAPAAQAQTLGPLVTISSGTPFAACTADKAGAQPGTVAPGGAVEPFAAADPTRPGYLLAGVQQDRWNNGGSRGVRAATSSDGGKTWATNVPGGISLCTGGKYQRATDPWVAFGPDGLAYYNALAFDNASGSANFGNSSVVTSVSSDGGLTWKAPVAQIADTGSKHFNDKNSITADPKLRGTAYVVWDRLIGFLDAFRDPHGSDDQRFAAEGAADNVSARVGTPRRCCTRRSSRADLRADVFFAHHRWRPLLVQGKGDLRPGCRRADDRQYRRRDAQRPSEDVFQQPFGARQFRDRLCRIDRSWNHLVQANQGSGPFRLRRADARYEHVLPSGRYSVQRARRPDLGRDLCRLGRYGARLQADYQGVVLAVARRRKDLVQPIAIHKTPSNKTVPLRGQAFNPAVTVADDGTVVATYYDFRNDTGKGGELTDAFAVFCQPGKARDCSKASAWGREQRLTQTSFDIDQAPMTDRGLFLGDYFGLATQGNMMWPVFRS